MTYWLGGAFGCAAPQADVVDQLIGHLETIRNSRRQAFVDSQWLSSEIYKEPSLVGLDRSHWPKVKVKPVRESVNYGRMWFRDMDVTEDDDQAHLTLESNDGHNPMTLDLTVMKLPAKNFSRVFENAALVEKQIADSIKDSNAEVWSRSNRAHLMLQPIKLAVDLATFPIRYTKQLYTQTQTPSTVNLNTRPSPRQRNP